jgi:signal transduction histidine kinase/DNA-binding NarL/FixJ family response regulator/ligand-binding sensor domain-containing protein
LDDLAYTILFITYKILSELGFYIRGVLFLFISLLSSQLCDAFQGQSRPFSWGEQTERYLIRKFTVAEGLPLNSSNYVVHHTDGYLYIATNDGLAKFDGFRFSTINTSAFPSLQSNRIRWVGSGNRGELWIVDSESNLYLYMEGELEWYQGREEVGNLEVQKIAKFDETRMLITTSQGIYIQKGEGLNFKRLPFIESHQDIANSFSFGNGMVLVLRNDGIYRLEGETIEMVFNASANQVDLDNIFNLVMGSTGTLWLLGYDGDLYEIRTDGTSKQHNYRTGDNIEFWDAIEEGPNRLTISSSTGYLGFDAITQSFSPDFITEQGEEYFEDNAWNGPNNHSIRKVGNTVFINNKPVLTTGKSITYLANDADGNIWVATNGDGVYQLVPQKVVMLGEDIFPGLQNIYGMAEVGEDIWVASFENEIFRISDDAVTNWTIENSRLDYSFFRTISPHNGKMYAGSFNLYYSRDEDWVRDEQWVIGSELIEVLFSDANNRLWIGTDQGLYLKEGNEYPAFFDRIGQTLNGVKQAVQFSENEIFFATKNQGIALYNSNNEFKFISREAGLSSNIVRDVFVKSPDSLWVATEDRGLNLVILDDAFIPAQIHQITEQDGLIDNSLHRIVRDSFGYFWINSNKGVMRVSETAAIAYLKGEREYLPVKSLGSGDGLTELEGNGGAQQSGMLTSDGKLLFSNQAGLMFTRPFWFVDNGGSRQKKLQFEWLQFGDSLENLSGKHSVNLPKNSRAVQVKFSLPEFSAPERVRLFYKMDGITENWQPAGTDRTAVLTNLPAGENVLEIRGYLEGDEDFVEQQLLIYVPAYFYETRWFLGVISILLAGLFYGGNRVLLKQANKRELRLNRLVQERTNQLVLEKEKTEQALQQVKKLDESKSRFFTNITHELRTPLSLILNPLDDMLKADGESVSGSRESLAMMRRNAVRLKDLVGQLLDVSKLNAGEFNLTYEPVDVTEVTRTIVAQFEHGFRRKNIRFSLIVETSDARLYLDVNAWTHIVSNLLSNALKFTPDGGQISVTFFDRENRLLCRITDSGMGIKPEELPHIFETYFQGDTSISKAEGTGIGLALVKGLIDRMNATIDVKSVPGERTTFTVSLKRGKTHISDADTILHSPRFTPTPELQNQIEIEPETSHSLGTQLNKVMLVEDNDDFRGYLTTVIGSEFEVKVAKNGVEGLTLLEDFNPDIIVSDIMMPEMDGLEMMQHIREDENMKTVPFIFLSAKDSAADIQKGLHAGADIYLSKPIENQLLLTQIKVLLRREASIRDRTQDVAFNSKPALVASVHEIISRHLGNPDLNVELIAASLSMSSPTLYRKWRKDSDETINKAIARLRFEEALKLIIEEDLTISEASYAVGFSNLSYFSNAFKKMYGKSPQEYVNEELKSSPA